MKAICRIRPLPHYRREAFLTGLRRAGYAFADAGLPESRSDLLVIWNRYGSFEREADRWEAEGGTVIVVENGYLGADEQGRQRYALSVHGHNGSGWFPLGNEDRFAALAVDVKPWRASGEHVVVRGQRGIGTALMRSPPRWHHDAAGRLSRLTSRRVRILEHPALHRHGPPPPPIEHELEGAWACVIWASSVGVKALVAGIPVFCEAPHWICKEATLAALAHIHTPLCDDARRLKALRQMAHGQWTVAEIESGEPFARMRERIGEATW